MKIHQLRNATILLDFGDKRILVDPMLARKGAIPSLKWVTPRRRRNPLVDLPAGTDELLSSVTHVLITHCQKGHFDHLDRAAIKWIRANKIPVICSLEDSGHLRSLGLTVHSLSPIGENIFFDGTIELVRCVHGKGLVGSLMAHGFGYYIKLPGHSSLYLIGDSVLTDEVRQTITTHDPGVVVMPGGGAQFDLGGEIIMGLDDVVPMAKSVKGKLIINHLEALDHCSVTRESIRALIFSNHLSRVLVPEDGEVIDCEEN